MATEQTTKTIQKYTVYVKARPQAIWDALTRAEIEPARCAEAHRVVTGRDDYRRQPLKPRSCANTIACARDHTPSLSKRLDA
jgi:hypothetical protein